MKTLTKIDLRDAIMDAFPDMSASAALRTVDNVIMLFKRAIFNRNKVMLPGLGKIQSKLKKPRIGRNPKTGATHQVSARHSITMAASGFNTGTFGKTSAITTLASDTVFNKADSTLLVNAFYALVGKVAEGNHRVELRGLGTFYPRVLAAGRQCHNPKTGEPVVVTDASVKVAFKCSPSLRKAMDKHYGV